MHGTAILFICCKSDLYFSCSSSDIFPIVLHFILMLSQNYESTDKMYVAMQITVLTQVYEVRFSVVVISNSIPAIYSLDFTIFNILAQETIHNFEWQCNFFHTCSRYRSILWNASFRSYGFLFHSSTLVTFGSVGSWGMSWWKAGA